MMERFSHLVWTHWRWSAFLAVLIAVLGVVALPFLRLEAGVDVFFAKGTTYRATLSEVREHFVNDEVAFVAYAGADPFSRETLLAIRQLGHELEQITITDRAGGIIMPVDEVRSLATVKTVVGGDGMFSSVPLVPDPVPEDAEGLALIRQRAYANPIVIEQLLSKTGDAAMMSVRLVTKLSDPQQAATVRQIRHLLDRAPVAHPHLRFYLLGEPVVNTDIAAYQINDLGTFIPVVYLSVALLLWLFLRRWRGMAVVLVSTTVCLGAAMAVLTATGGTVNNCSVLLPPLILALSVASILHFIVEYGKNALEHPTADPAVLTLSQVSAPAWMAAVTTAVAFASLLTSNVPAVFHFGLAASISMIVVFAIAVAFVTLGMRRFGPQLMISARGVALAPTFDRFLAWLSTWIIRRHRILFAATLGLLLLIGLGIPRIVVDQSSVEFFNAGTPIRVANEFINERLGGTTLYVASIRTHDRGRFYRPAELGKLSDLDAFLRREVDAQVVVSIADHLKLMNREMNDGRTEEHRIPDTAEQVAQLMLLNGDNTVRELIDESQEWVRVVARSSQVHSKEIYDAHMAIERYLADHFPADQGYTTHSTGQSRLWSNLFWDLINSQVLSLSLSAVLIFALMFVMFRSVVAGSYAVPPNVLPVVVTFGVMGWFGIRLDTATVMSATVTLGIAVDDTVHAMQHLRSCLRRGADLPGAVRETLHHKGPGMIATSVVISLGFLVLLSASFVPTRHFGILTVIAMVSALIGDLIFLPAMLLTTGTRLGVPLRRGEPAGGTAPRDAA